MSSLGRRQQINRVFYVEVETMKGKKIKQINNLTIRYTEEYQYSVWTPDGRCWEDRMTLEQAEEFCRNTKDFVNK